MRRFYSLALLFVVAMFCSTAYGYTGKEDITSSKLTNADFSADTPVAYLVRTYAKDMTDEGAGAGGAELYGMQAVTGWTASNPTDNIKHTTDGDPRDAKAGGVFEIFTSEGEVEELEESRGLGGEFYCIGEQGGGALGVVGVWGSAPTYSQELTLPAGYYILVFNLYNSGAGSTLSSNLIGFDAGDVKFMSTKTSYPIREWVSDTILVSLDKETTGNLTLGFGHSGGSGNAPHLFFDNVKIFTVEEAEVLAEEIAEAKAVLLNLINIGKMYEVDTTESERVYNNPSATLDEVNAAIENQKAINATGITDLSPYFIINSHFDLDDPVSGGICTYDYDMSKNGVDFFGSQPLTGWDALNVSDNTLGASNRKENGRASGVYAIGSGAWIGGTGYVVPNVMSDGSSEGKVLGFVTCWSQTVQYKQAVTLPAGEYTLSLSYYNTGGTSAIAKNLIGFVTDGGTEYLSDNLTFPVGEWTSDEIKFTLDEETSGYFTLGYIATNSGSGAMPHFFTDGISLIYAGNVDAATLALNSAIRTAKLLQSENFYTQLKTALDNMIPICEAVAEEGDTKEKKECYEDLTALISEIKANIAAYAQLDEFYNEGGALFTAIMKYDEERYPALATNLGTISDGAMSALMDYNWDTETINKTISSLPQVIKEGVQAAWDAAVAAGTVYEDEGIDISVLFEGIGENGNFNGWTTTKGSIGVQFNVAEVYENTPFVASRTLEALPKGKYTVATHGFYRIASNDINYDDYHTTDVFSYVFAGATKNLLSNVATVTFDNADAFAGLAETSSGSGIYVINNREGASQIFDDATYAPKFEASSAATLTGEKENLTFGIRADEMQSMSWTTWYQFSIFYNGVKGSDLYTELTDQIMALSEKVVDFEVYLEENQETITNPMSDDADEAATTAGDLIDNADEVANTYDEATETFDGYTTDEVVLCIDKVKAGIALIDSVTTVVASNIAAVDSCVAARNTLDETLNDPSLTPSDEAIAEAEQLLDEDATDDAIANMTTDEVRAITVRIAEATGALKIPDDMKNASDANPYDASDLIVNNSFEGDGSGSTDGWTYNTKATGDTGARDLSNATYAYTSAYGEEVGSYTFNTWSGGTVDGGFYVAQTVTAVPAGTYELKALIAADLESEISLTVNGDGKTYYLTTPKEEATEAHITFALEEKGDLDIRVSSPSWFKADYFRLTYFGTGSSHQPDVTEVDEIEVSDSEITAIFNAAGAQIPALQPGLNFVQYGSGKVVKLFKK